MRATIGHSFLFLSAFLAAVLGKPYVEEQPGPGGIRIPLPVTISSTGNTVDVSDRAGRLLGLIANTGFTATQGSPPWTVDLTKFNGTTVVTGYGPSGTGIPRVTTSADDTSGSTTFSASAGATGASCPAASATAVTSNTSCLVIPLTGQVGAVGDVQGGTLAATVKYEQSFDGGTSWATSLVLVNGAQGSSLVLTNPNPDTSANWYLPEGASHVRLYVSAYTSGSALTWGRATKIVSPLAVGAISSTVPGLAVPSFATYIAGQARTSLPTANANATLTPFSTDVYGRLLVHRYDTWAINNAPAAAAQATISQAAAGTSIKNVCTSISITLSSDAAPTVGIVTFNLRDGATGAGTIKQTWKLSLPAVPGESRVFGLADLWIEGTANTAMTLETAAATPANVTATVSMTGTTTQ